ncbi:MAG: glycosyltransferase, partial [Myxococcales bacterium]|nr:glycosyltransferase [Myxococcales bacterium]
SFDGALQPLGHSQVVRLLVLLARAGHRYSLVTLERAADLAAAERVNALRGQLTSAGITWRYGTYHEGATGAARNLAQLSQLAERALREDSIGLVHARGYQPAVVARWLRARHGLPYIFDFRGLWIDERLEEGRWFTNRAALAVARRVERTLFQDAAAVVSLAEPGADLLRSGALTGSPYCGPLVVIPTSVDFDAFTLPGDAGRAEGPEPLREWAGEDLLLGWVGSLNRWYDTDASMDLVRRVIDKRPAAKLLVLSQQRDAMQALLEKHHLTQHSLIFQVSHDEMPGWVRHLDWGLQLMGTSRAKAASMPTKFAEFIASGVRPVHHGCNVEVGSWVTACATGINLPDLTGVTLDACAEKVTSSRIERSALVSGRTALMEHFSIHTAA